jgi:DNA-binding NtrC family response regulator
MNILYCDKDLKSFNEFEKFYGSSTNLYFTENIRDAIVVLIQKKIDILIIELNFSIDSCYYLVNHSKKNYPNLKIAIVSAYCDEMVLEIIASDLMVKNFFKNPIDQNMLQSIL